MQLSRSFFIVALFGSLISVPVAQAITDNQLKATAAALAIGAVYLYNRTVSNDPNKNPVTAAADVLTKGLHQGDALVRKWMPTALVGTGTFWAAYHNLNIPNTYAVQHVKNLVIGTAKPS